MANTMSSPTRHIDRLIDYVFDEKPGEAPGSRYVAASAGNGFVANPKSSKRIAAEVMRRFNKQTGFVQGYHVIDSYALDELDPTVASDVERAQVVGRERAKRLAGGRPYLVVTQIDGKGSIEHPGGKLHNHIVILSVHPVTGRSFDSSLVTHKRLAAEHDEVLKECGVLQTLDPVTGHAREVFTPTELRVAAERMAWEVRRDIAAMDGEVFDEVEPEEHWLTVLKRKVRGALADPRAVDRDALVTAARADHGLDVRFEGKGVSYSLRDENGETTRQTRKGSRLGADFMVETVDAVLLRNAHLVASVHQPVAAASVTGPRVPLPVERAEKAIDGEADVPVRGAAPRYKRRGGTPPKDVARDEVISPEPGVGEPVDPEVERAALLRLYMQVHGQVADQDLATLESRLDELIADDPTWVTPTRAEVETDYRRLVLGMSDTEAFVPEPAEEENREASERLLAQLQAEEAARAAKQTPPVAPATSGQTGPSAAPAASAGQTAAPAAATRQSGQQGTVQEAAEGSAYVSRLRTLHGKTEAAQALIDAMAGFDEDCHARLAQGLRPVEADISAGYGPKAHARFREYLADNVVAQLDLRFAKKDARREAFETGRDLAAEIKAMRAAGKHWTDEFEVKVRQRDAANARRKRLEAELAAGVYEPVAVGSVIAQPVPAMLRPTPGQQRDGEQLG